MTSKMSSNSNWSSKDDEILISFVRNHEAIYYIKSKEYRKTQLKQNWWREIGKILNKTDFDCAKRWCYIRDYYVRRRGKPVSSGEAAKKRSVLLSFLDNLPSSQKSSITNVIDENRGNNSVKMEKSHDNSKRTQIPENESLVTDNSNNSKETQSNSQEIENFKCDNNGHRKYDKAKNDKKANYNAHGQEGLGLLEDSTQNGLHENDLFFAAMAKIVKKLPPYEQIQLRMQIGSLVGNAELRHL
ncbi:hypothetical protein evm_004092 [Chilo suppressalis]|nr:hypothetical protein evm_004092 [Chilo suppressalis]